MLLLLLSSALAHTPHDVARFAAASEGAPLTVGMNREHWVLASADEDLGFRYLLLDAAQIGGGVTGGAWIGGALHWSTDGAGLWRLDGDAPIQIDAIGADASLDAVVADPLDPRRAVATGPGQTWLTEDGGERWSLSSAPGFVDVAFAPAGGVSEICGLDGLGVVHCSPDGVDWEDVGGPDTPGRGLAISQSGALLVATAGEGLLRGDGGDWARVDEGEDGWATIEALGDRLIAASELEAAWISDDDGLSFERASAGIEPPEEGRGNPSTGPRYNDLQSGDRGAYLAAWEGVFRSQDGGAAWQQLPLLGPEVHRSAAISLDGDGAATIWAPSYDGGLGAILLDASGSGSWRLASGVAMAIHLRAAAPSPAEDGPIWMTERGNLWGSEDGTSWVRLDGDGALEYVEEIAATAGVLIVAGQRDDAPHLAFSVDGGAAYVDLTDGDDDGSKIAHVAASPGYPDSGAVYAVTFDPVIWGRALAGGGFEALELLDFEPQELAVQGEDTPWIAAADGLYRGGPDGGFERVALEDRWVTAVAFAPGGEGLAAAGADLWYTADGASWIPIEGPGATVLGLALSPDFAADGIAAAATYRGVWVTADAGGSWSLATNRLRVDQESPLWSMTDGWVGALNGDASGGSLHTATSAGEIARLPVRAGEIGIRARGGAGQGALRWRLLDLETGAIDAEGEVDLAASEAGLGQIQCAAIEPAWRTLEIEVVAGPVSLDGVDLWLEDGLIGSACEPAEPIGEAPEDPRCGCTDQAVGGGWWLLGLAGLVRRRRVNKSLGFS